ncbi:MAG: hypothetical protein ACRDPG_05325, partial [Nocardioidaceae bacterium]
MTPGPPQLSTGLAVEPERQCSRGHPNPAANNYCAQCGLRLRPGGPPSWNTLAEMFKVVTYRPHLQRTLLT